jgi:hypothetical protein
MKAEILIQCREVDLKQVDTRNGICPHLALRTHSTSPQHVVIERRKSAGDQDPEGSFTVRFDELRAAVESLAATVAANLRDRHT